MNWKASSCSVAARGQLGEECQLYPEYYLSSWVFWAVRLPYLICLPWTVVAISTLSFRKKHGCVLRYGLQIPVGVQSLWLTGGAVACMLLTPEMLGGDPGSAERLKHTCAYNQNGYALQVSCVSDHS